MSVFTRPPVFPFLFLFSACYGQLGCLEFGTVVLLVLPHSDSLETGLPRVSLPSVVLSLDNGWVEHT